LFTDIQAACQAIGPLTQAGAMMVELMDRASIRAVENQPGMPAELKLLGPAAAALLVEFQEQTPAALNERVTSFLANARQLSLLNPPAFTTAPAEQAKLWKMRKGLFPAVGAVRASGTTVILEDVAFPVEQLGPAILDLQALFDRHGYDNAIIFGHAKDGNLHFVVTQAFANDAEIARYDRFLREVVGTRSMDFVLYEGRTAVAAEVQKQMQQILDRYETGIQVSSVAIQNVQPPEPVQAAFDDAVKAGQDRERQINEGQAYRNQIVPLAAGQSSRMLEQAEGYRARVVGNAVGDAARFTSVLGEYRKAPEVLRERMYLETMQQMYSNASKILVDTSGSNNMLYLPLDKITQQAAQGAQRINPMANTPVHTNAPAPLTQPSPVTRPAAPGPINTLTRDRGSR
jgi:HflK protein